MVILNGEVSDIVCLENLSDIELHGIRYLRHAINIVR
jgi:hypothetical protein